jgi:hypothetical protein
MNARRNRSTDSADDLFDFFAASPIWIGPIFAFLMFAVLRWIFPSIISSLDSKNPIGNSFWHPLQVILNAVAPWAAVFVLFAWVLAELWKLKNRKRLDQAAD